MGCKICTDFGHRRLAIRFLLGLSRYGSSPWVLGIASGTTEEGGMCDKDSLSTECNFNIRGIRNEHEIWGIYSVLKKFWCFCARFYHFAFASSSDQIWTQECAAPMFLLCNVDARFITPPLFHLRASDERYLF